jgi:hypothetical protein
MTALNHLRSRLVDVTGLTVITSSQAAAPAARLAVIVALSSPEIAEGNPRLSPSRSR